MLLFGGGAAGSEGGICKRRGTFGRDKAHLHHFMSSSYLCPNVLGGKREDFPEHKIVRGLIHLNGESYTVFTLDK